MRILSIITVKNDIVQSIVSFGIFEEQLSNDVKKIADDFYIEKCEEIGFEETEKLTTDDIISYGFYVNKNTTINYVVSHI